MSENDGPVVDGSHEANSAAPRDTNRHLGKLTSLLGGACVTVAAMVPAVILAAPAEAASALGACFSYDGARYQGLTSVLEYRTTADDWAVFPGSASPVDPTGCANYTISAAAQGYDFRITAVGVTADHGVFYGASAFYGSAGSDRFWLGETALAYYSGTDSWSASAPAWLADMATIQPHGSCQTNPALTVACWMDANGLHGNTIVLPVDHDGDHVPAGIDHDDENRTVQ